MITLDVLPMQSTLKTIQAFIWFKWLDSNTHPQSWSAALLVITYCQLIANNLLGLLIGSESDQKATGIRLETNVFWLLWFSNLKWVSKRGDLRSPTLIELTAWNPPHWVLVASILEVPMCDSLGFYVMSSMQCPPRYELHKKAHSPNCTPMYRETAINDSDYPPDTDLGRSRRLPIWQIVSARLSDRDIECSYF